MAGARLRVVSGVRPALVMACAWSLAGPAAAQATCHAESFAGGDLITERDWTFDAEGRIASFAYLLDPAADATYTEDRYGTDGQVVEERTRIDEGPDPSRYGWQPAATITTERRDAQVVTRGPDGDGGVRTTTYTLDAGGRPTSIAQRPAAEGDDEQLYCAFDLAGRPLYLGIERDGEERGGRRWEWRGDRLVREVRFDREGNETPFTIRYRGDTIEIASPDRDEVERWRGACAPLLFERCAPIHGPARPDGTRAAVPRPDGRAVPAGPRRRVAFGAGLGDDPLTLDGLRRAYPGYDVWTSIGFWENSPNVPYPIVCIGRGGRCATSLRHDDEGRTVEASSRDPSLAAAPGVRVGARGRAIAHALERCTIERGLEVGVACRLRGQPRVEVWLDATPALLEADGDSIAPSAIGDRRVEALVWRRVPREADAP